VASVVAVFEVNYEVFRNFRVVLSRYAGSVMSVAAALLLSRLLENSTPGLFVFPFLAAVLVSARCASKRTAALTILLSALAVAYFILPPVNSFAVQPNALPLFASFIGCAITLTWLTTEPDEADLRQKSHKSSRYALKQSGKPHGVKHATFRRLELVMIGAMVFGISALYWAPAALYYHNWWGGFVFALVIALGITGLVARRWR
jgi:Domain of unknown function (DUF4118)